jgi:hypothetical protein
MRYTTASVALDTLARRSMPKPRLKVTRSK